MIGSIKIANLATFCLLVITQTYAQSDTVQGQKIELIHADALEYDESSGNKAKKLIGHVQFKHDQTDLFCDSAYLYTETNSLNAYGHVRILNYTGETIFGDSLHYNGNTKLAKLRGHIIMIDKEQELKTSYIDYNLKNNMAYYLNGGVLKNKKDKSVLKSVYGYYYTERKEFFFKKNVDLQHPKYHITSDTMMHNTATNITYFLGKTEIKDSTSQLFCHYGWFDQNKNTSWLKKNAEIIQKNQSIKGDSIFYDENRGIGEAYGHVCIRDTTEKIEITGHYGYYQEKDSVFLVTFNALLTQFDKDDTLYLHADTLFSYYDTNVCNRMILAYHHCKFYKRDLQGGCDSLVYFKNDSLMNMHINPMLWSDSSQLSADFIKIKQTKEGIDSLWMNENAWIISELDSTKYNQINAVEIRGKFRHNKLDKIFGYEQCKTLYYPEDDKKVIGLNKVNSDRLEIVFLKDGIDKIKFFSPQKSELVPLSQVSPSERKLSGFKWDSVRRPKTKQDVFKP